MSWLNMKSDADCEMKCKHGEVCISGPIDERPRCVYKKELKKSVKLFHRFHKSEVKPWRKFQKQHYKKELKWMKKQDKLDRKKAGWKKHHMRKHGDHHFMKKKNWKKYGGEGHMKKENLKKYHLKKHGDEDYMKKEYLENGVDEERMKYDEWEKKHLKKYGGEENMRKEDLEKEYVKKHGGEENMEKEDLEKEYLKYGGEDFMKKGDWEKEYLKHHGDEDFMKNDVLEKERSVDLTKKEDLDMAMIKELDLPNPVEEGDGDFKHSMDGKDNFQNGFNPTADKQIQKIKYIPDRSLKPDSKGECSDSQFVQMRTRMMGWFHFLHGQDHLARKAHGGSIAKFYKHVSVKKELRDYDGLKCGCLKSAMWQFHQLDKSVDDQLSLEEIAVLEENSEEPCIKPFLRSCDRNGDEILSSDEWCCCFSHVLAPCYRRIDEIKRTKDQDAYIPRCDKEGYYMREQCKSGADEKLKCWCVDVNGTELKGTFTTGRAHCSKRAMEALKQTPYF